MEKCDIQKTILAGLEIPFWNLVWFMVKLALASIPALFILYFILFLFAMLFGSVMHLFMVPPGPGI